MCGIGCAWRRTRTLLHAVCIQKAGGVWYVVHGVAVALLCVAVVAVAGATGLGLVVVGLLVVRARGSRGAAVVASLGSTASYDKYCCAVEWPPPPPTWRLCQRRERRRTRTATAPLAPPQLLFRYAHTQLPRPLRQCPCRWCACACRRGLRCARLTQDFGATQKVAGRGGVSVSRVTL